MESQCIQDPRRALFRLLNPRDPLSAKDLRASHLVSLPLFAFELRTDPSDIEFAGQHSLFQNCSKRLFLGILATQFASWLSKLTSKRRP